MASVLGNEGVINGLDSGIANRSAPTHATMENEDLRGPLGSLGTCSWRLVREGTDGYGSTLRTGVPLLGTAGELGRVLEPRDGHDLQRLGHRGEHVQQVDEVLNLRPELH